MEKIKSLNFSLIKWYLTFELKVILFVLLPLIVFTLITSRVVIVNINSFVVISGSMQPTIPTGSLIFSQKKPEYNINDVIVFKQGSAIVTHRIAEVVNQNNSYFYKTKGDANNVIDEELVAQKDIVGKGVIFFKHIGKLTLLLKTPLGFIGLIILPIFIFIGIELWNIKKELVKETEKRLIEKLALDE